MSHLKIEHVLGTFKPNVCVANGVPNPFPHRYGDHGLAYRKYFKTKIAFTVTLRSLCRNVIENKCISDLRRFGSAF